MILLSSKEFLPFLLSGRLEANHLNSFRDQAEVQLSYGFCFYKASSKSGQHALPGHSHSEHSTENFCAHWESSIGCT